MSGMKKIKNAWPDEMSVKGKEKNVKNVGSAAVTRGLGASLPCTDFISPGYTTRGSNGSWIMEGWATRGYEKQAC